MEIEALSTSNMTGRIVWPTAFKELGGAGSQVEPDLTCAIKVASRSECSKGNSASTDDKLPIVSCLEYAKMSTEAFGMVVEKDE